VARAFSRALVLGCSDQEPFVVTIYGVSCGLGPAFAPRFRLLLNPTETIGEPSSLEFFTVWRGTDRTLPQRVRQCLSYLRRGGNLVSDCCCFKHCQADMRIIREEALGD
jgi:hypothetical protein